MPLYPHDRAHYRRDSLLGDRLDDAALGDDAGDEARRSHVERRVIDIHTVWRCRAAEAMLGDHFGTLENRYSSDQPTLLRIWKDHGHSLDLLEPFGRIREALEEAQKGVRAAA